MWLSDRFPGLMLWHTVAVLAAVFAAKALLYWAADWLVLGPLYSVLAGDGRENGQNRTLSMRPVRLRP